MLTETYKKNIVTSKLRNDFVLLNIHTHIFHNMIFFLNNITTLESLGRRY